jgi:hypothetical protein
MFFFGEIMQWGLYTTSGKGDIAGLLRALMARGVQVIKNIPASIIIVTELEEKGCQQAADITNRLRRRKCGDWSQLWHH